MSAVRANDQKEQQEGMEYTSSVMCRAEFYKRWSAESICDECEGATQAAQEEAPRDVARVLIDYRAMNERADRIAAAQQLRQALEAADLLVAQMNEEQGHGGEGCRGSSGILARTWKA